MAQAALKAFAALVSAGLAATTVLGLYVAWNGARRTALLLCFAAGVLLPLAAMLLV